MNFILSKKIKYYTKESLRWIGLIVFGLLIIALVIWIKYKPVYSVTFLEKEIGMVTNKNEIENTLQEYTETTYGDIAFITLKELPEYELKFVESGEKTNEEEVLLAVKNTAIVTYRRYAITLAGIQKAIVSTKEEAQNVVDEIKKEFNQDLELDLKIIELYDSNDIVPETVEVAVAKVNEDEIVQTKLKEQGATVNGITLSAPITGTITSRFGGRRSGYHTGLDIAASTGTPIAVAASGTVTYAGNRGTYGKLVIVSHGNGVETYYAHCNEIYVTTGQNVESGEIISAVGSTGNSTGPHLHLEVRVNGEIKNPQNYLYK